MSFMRCNAFSFALFSATFIIGIPVAIILFAVSRTRKK